MKENERKQLKNEQERIILDRNAKLSGTDYVETKIVDAICNWAKGEKRTVGALAESILALVGDDGQYSGYPENKQKWRDDINAAQAEIERLDSIEVEPDVRPEVEKEEEEDA